MPKAPQTKFSTQNILNNSYNTDFDLLEFLLTGFDGQNAVKLEADDLQTKIVESGGYTYVCKAAVGTAESSQAWKIFRIDSSGSKMYADGDSEFDNVATDPTALSYSYT